MLEIKKYFTLPTIEFLNLGHHLVYCSPSDEVPEFCVADDCVDETDEEFNAE